MPRTFTQATMDLLNTAKADDYNKDVLGALQEFNGKLDQHNMPLRGVKYDKLVASVPYGTLLVGGSQGPVNGYHFTSQSGTFSWSYTAGEWRVGWNPLSDKMGVPGAYLEFDAQEGMIKGAAVIDAERRTFKRSFGDPVITAEWTTANWFEVGIFVNDVLVARSGKVFGRRFTFDLPFAAYVGNETVAIEARWRAIDLALPSGSTGYVPPDFNIYSGTIWARNQVR